MLKYLYFIVGALLIISFISFIVVKDPSSEKLTTDEFITNFDKLIIKEPISVGFDIDFTVLFTYPCFYKYINEYVTKYGLENISSEEQMKIILAKQSFWDDMGQCDIYSLPKTSALKLIKFHQKRGDKIYFITARSKPSDKYTHILNNYLIKIIGDNSNLHDVIYAGNKIQSIKDNNILLFYGDSDSDIHFANEAGAKGVRFLRSTLTLQYYPNDYHIGKFNEIILTDSDH